MIEKFFGICGSDIRLEEINYAKTAYVGRSRISKIATTEVILKGARALRKTVYKSFKIA